MGRAFLVYIVGNIISSFVLYFGGVIYARVLSPELYGQYSFAISIVSIFLLINGGGVAVGVLQFASKRPSQALGYVRFALNYGSRVNLVLVCLLLVGSFFYPESYGGQGLFLAFLPLLFFRLPIDIMDNHLRATQRIGDMTRLLCTNSLCVVVFALLGAYYFGIYGVIIGTYMGYIISYFLTLSLWRPIAAQNKYQLEELPLFKKFSWQTGTSNVFSQALYLLDAFILGVMTNHPASVGIYKAATIIPFALNGTMAMVMSYFYPIIVRSTQSRVSLRRLYLRLFFPALTLSILMAIGCEYFAKDIIQLVFGHHYMAAVEPFRILMVGAFIVIAFRSVSGNFISALGKSNVNLGITILCFILNLIVSPLMIYFYGINGAAVGVLVIYIFSSVLGVPYLLMKLFGEKGYAS